SRVPPARSVNRGGPCLGRVVAVGAALNPYGFRLTVENMSHPSITHHEVLVAVFQKRRDTLCVLLWQRALEPQTGTWSLPGGKLGDDEDLPTSATRQLAEKV